MKHMLLQDQDVITVKIEGELTVNDEDDFRELSFEVSDLDAKRCVIDISDLQFLDSAGLGLMLVMKELCEEKEKSISVMVGDSPVRDILEISEFESLIPFEGAQS